MEMGILYGQLFQASGSDNNKTNTHLNGNKWINIWEVCSSLPPTCSWAFLPFSRSPRWCCSWGSQTPADPATDKPGSWWAGSCPVSRDPFRALASLLDDTCEDWRASALCSQRQTRATAARSRGRPGTEWEGHCHHLQGLECLAL